MTMKKLKKILANHNLKLWQLAKILNINRTTLTQWGHYDFNGHHSTINHGLHELITK